VRRQDEGVTKSKKSFVSHVRKRRAATHIRLESFCLPPTRPSFAPSTLDAHGRLRLADESHPRFTSLARVRPERRAAFFGQSIDLVHRLTDRRIPSYSALK
jgi:hypothetical protein